MAISLNFQVVLQKKFMLQQVKDINIIITNNFLIKINSILNFNFNILNHLFNYIN